MKAKIAFVFYHDGINATQYQPGDELPEDVAVPAEWTEASEPATATEPDPGDELPEDVAVVKTGRGKK